MDLGGDNRGMRREESIFEIETPVAIVTVCRSGRGDRTTPALVHYRRIAGTAEEKLQILSEDSADLDAGLWQVARHDWHAPFTPPSGGRDWTGYPLLIDLFPWQQPGCKFGRTWPIAPDRATLEARWRRFVSTDDPDDRARCFVTPTSGRNIQTRATGLTRLVDEPIGAPPPSIARYGYRSFDRQFAFDDPRMAKTESPSLWAGRSEQQIFMVSKPTHPLGAGSAATATVYVPDLHHFRGSFGGKDVIPLYRDAAGTPNVHAEALLAITAEQRAQAPTAPAVTAELLFAYSYGILAGTNYTERFAEALETPGPRVPLSADPGLFAEAAALGRQLLWLQTYGERFTDGHESEALRHSDVELLAPITSLPTGTSEIRYDSGSQVLAVGDGRVRGVSPEVWHFEVSGMTVVRKWLGYRTAKGSGRAAGSSSPLDQVRPSTWSDAWTEELLELLSVLQRTVDLLPIGIDLLHRICQGPLVTVDDLPAVPAALRQPPTVNRAAVQRGFDL